MSAEHDLLSMTPEEFVQRVASSDDATIRADLERAGTADGLDRIFAIMQERFVPERAGGRTATVQWRIADGSTTHAYVVELADGTCTTRRGEAQRPTATISTDTVRFIRLSAGLANPAKLLLTRKVKVSGDLDLARRFDSFFDIPRP